MTRARNSANLASQGNLFVDIANDRTGIGSVVPAQNLHVAGTAGFHADTTFVGDSYNVTWDRSENRLKFDEFSGINFGNNNELQINHRGTSYILNIDSMPLQIGSNSLQLMNAGTTQTYLNASLNSDLLLYRAGSERFRTKDYGVQITGTTDTDGLVVSGVATVTTMNVTGVLTYDDVTSVDSVGIVTARQGVRVTADGSTSANYISAGASDNLKIYHSGGTNVIYGTAPISIQTNNTTSGISFVSTGGHETIAKFVKDGDCTLFRDNSPRIKTTAGGIEVSNNLGLNTGIGEAIKINTAPTNTNDGSKISFARSSTVYAEIVTQKMDASNKTDLYFKTGTSPQEKLRITSDGDFGTNGVTPTTQSGRVFHLHAGNAQQRFHMTNSTTGVSATDGFEILIDQESNANCRIRNFEAGYMAFDTGGSNNEVMRLTSDGDVGINVTPISGVTLQVGTPNTSTGVMRGHPDYFSIDSGSSAGGGVVGSATTAALIFGGDGNTGLYHSASDTLNFTTGGTERLRIDSSGRLLVGAAAIQYHNAPFYVSGNDPVIGAFHHSDGGTNDEARIALGALSSNPPYQRGVYLTALNNGAGHDFIVATSPSHSLGPTEKLRIGSDGQLHTGYTSGFGNDHLNILASDGGGISIAQNNSGNASSGTVLGSLSIQGYLNTQTHSNAEVKISGIAAADHTGSSAATDMVFYTKPSTTGPGSAPTERLRILSTGSIQQTANSGVSYFKGSSEYIFGTSLSSPSSGGAEGKFQIHDYKTRATVSINAYMNNAGAPFVQFVSSRSGTPGVLGTKAAINDYHGDIRFMGDNGTNYQTLVQSAQILVRQKSTISDGDTVCAGEMQFWVGSDTGGSVIERLKIYNSGGVVFSKTTQGGAHHTGNTGSIFFKVGEWTGVGSASRCKLTVIGASTFDSGSDCSGMTHIYLAMNADSAVKGYFNSTGGPSYSHMSATGRQGVARVAVKRSSGSAPFTVEVWVAYNTGYSSNSVYGETTVGTAFVGFNVNTNSSDVPSGADELESAFTVQTASGGTSYERLLIKHNGGVIAPGHSGGFIDNSYHANPDPFADGSGLAYYRMNYNFQDSGLYGFHGTGSQGSPNKEFNASPHFSLVNSVGEPCWDNPNEGQINIPNLKNSYPFSMAAWINVSSWPTSADNDLIMNLSIANQRISLSICCFGSHVSDGADFYIMYGGNGHHFFRPSSKPTNEWIHVVYSVVGDDNTDHRVYQNGADLTTRGNRGGGHGGSAGWALGGNAGGSERFSIGRIGSIRFFNKALSSSEATTLYNNDKFIA